MKSKEKKPIPIFISNWWPLFSSPSLVSVDSLEGGAPKTDVELKRAREVATFSKVKHSSKYLIEEQLRGLTEGTCFQI